MLYPHASFVRLSVNARGTDYYIGDLHGCMEALQLLLAAVDFRTEHDRLISVGDLVDKGRDPVSALWLLRDAPWFHAVTGNHEQMQLAAASRKAGILSQIDSVPVPAYFLRHTNEPWYTQLGFYPVSTDDLETAENF